MDDLAQLSAKATQGLWEHEFTPGETSGGEININGEFALLVAGGNHALWRDTECGGDTEFQANGDLAAALVNAYRAGELVPATTLAAKDAEIARLRQNVRGWVKWHSRCGADDDCTYLNDNAWCDAEALASTGMGLLATRATGADHD